MGLACRQIRRRSANHHYPESGQSHLARPVPHLRQRRLGARLLPEIQQPPSRISRCLVERGQLGRDQQPLQCLQIRQSSSRTRTSPPLRNELKNVAPDAFVRGCFFLGSTERRQSNEQGGNRGSDRRLPF